MNILVTGGAGFIGSHVVDLLVSRGHKVLVLDNFSTGTEANLSPLSRDGLFISREDIESFFFPASLEKTDAIIHLAAQASITRSLARPRHDLIVNTLGTLNIIQFAQEHGVKRIVFASTSAVYEEKNTLLRETSQPRPASPYGISKLAAENYLRCLFPSSVILRLGNVYGPRQVSIGENQVVARMIDHVLCGKPFTIHGDGNQKRDFVYVEDVAEAFFLGMYADPGIYNIARGRSVSVNGVAAVLARVLGSPVEWKHDDQIDPRRNVNMAVRLAQSKLNWEARTSLSDGLKKTVGWAKEKNNG